MKNKIISALIVLAGICLSGCKDSFLDRIPGNSYVDGNFYASDDALEAATAPLYNRAWFDYNRRPIMYLGSTRANDFYSPWAFPEFTTFQVTALSEDLANAWKSFYSVITMANQVIDDVNTKCTADVTEESKIKAIAESRLMRACAYFYMIRAWGSVIIIEHNQDVVDNPVRPLNREEDVFQFIINDLTYAAENLPETGSQPGRATRWAAEGMLAKVYLARSGWKKGGQRDEEDLELAKQYAADVCDNSGLELLPNYEDLFKYKFNNNEESLLAMQWVPLGEWGTNNCLLSELAFSSEVIGGENAWSGFYAGIDMLQQYELADTLRRNATFFTNGTYYPYICIADGGYTYKDYGSPIKKGVPGGADDNDGYVGAGSSPLNTYILRLADVYLTYAEACLGNNESLNSGPGLEYFNKVRYRGFNGNGTWKKSSITLDDIIRERRIEHCAEFSNWYDMVSWYCWKPEKMLDYFNNKQLRGYRADATKKDERGYLHFGRYDNSGNFLEGEEYYNAPTVEINITDDDIFLPYPESDVIQNPLLREDPVPYNFNE